MSAAGNFLTGIIGGTGLSSMDGLEILEKREISTPFGAPSSAVVLGRLAGRDLAFLPRHGEHHQILPGEINFRANLWALKSVGVRRVLSVSAVGSLAGEIRPGDLSLVKQYIDFTRGRRAGSFFGDGLVAHVSTAEPACPALEAQALAAAKGLGEHLHRNKTYACVEGPRLGTRAESFFFRQAGCDLVGMTNVPEAFLAREAQLCYCTVAVATDYDCWLDDPDQHVTVDKVFALYRQSLGRVKTLLTALVSRGEPGDNGSDDDDNALPCSCRTSLQGALLSDEKALSPEKKLLLSFLRV